MSENQRVEALFQKAFSLKEFIEKYENASIFGESWHFDEELNAWIREIQSVPINEYERLIITAWLEGLNDYVIKKEEGKYPIYWIRINLEQKPPIYLGVQLFSGYMYIYERLDCPQK